MTSIQSSVPSLSSFQALAKTGDAVVLKGGNLESTSATPAKQGFFSRILNWIRGDNSAKLNGETRAAFVASVGKGFTQKGLENILRKSGFDAGGGKPLSSREITNVLSARTQHFDEAKQLKGLIDGMKLIQVDVKKKEAIYKEKSAIVKNSPSEKTYSASKNALQEVRAARAQALAQSEKIKELVSKMNA